MDIKTIGIDMGHSLSGAGTGAVALMSEVVENRKIGKRLITMLQENGYTVVNCTTDYANSTGEQLAGIVEKANDQHLDIFVSIHLNAGGGNGVETWIYSEGSSSKPVAVDVTNAVASSCNFTNRGIKYSTGLCVLKNTNAPAMLVEVCFTDSQTDKNKLNCEAVAKAIYKGLTGKEYVAPAPVETPAGTMFRVVVGTYAERKNAEEQQAKLKNAGFDSFLVAYTK